MWRLDVTRRKKKKKTFPKFLNGGIHGDLDSARQGAKGTQEPDRHQTTWSQRLMFAAMASFHCEKETLPFAMQDGAENVIKVPHLC